MCTRQGALKLHSQLVYRLCRRFASATCFPHTVLGNVTEENDLIAKRQKRYRNIATTIKTPDVLTLTTILVSLTRTYRITVFRFALAYFVCS